MSNYVYSKKQIEIIKRLEEAGIEVSVGKKQPHNGSYSGIIGNKKKALELKLPN